LRLLRNREMLLLSVYFIARFIPLPTLRLKMKFTIGKVTSKLVTTCGISVKTLSQFKRNFEPRSYALWI
jgi:hypothetical protein